MKKPIIIYLSIWTILVISFWCGFKNDALLFSGIATMIMVIITSIVPWQIVIAKPTRKVQLLVIASMGIMMMLQEYLTFSLSNNIAFNKVNMPDWGLMIGGMFIAFIGTEIVIKKKGK